MTGHLIIPEILVFSKRTWQTLSKEDQDLITKLGRRRSRNSAALWYEMEKKSLAT